MSDASANNKGPAPAGINNEAPAANYNTNNTKEHQIAPGSQRNPDIDNDPKTTNRAQKAAPMPEYAGKTKEEQTLSAGSASNGEAKTGSGKGPAHV